MKTLIILAFISVGLFSCHNNKQKDEAFNSANQKIVVDAVAVDNDETETTSGSGMATLPL